MHLEPATFMFLESRLFLPSILQTQAPNLEVAQKRTARIHRPFATLTFENDVLQEHILLRVAIISSIHGLGPHAAEVA